MKKLISKYKIHGLVLAVIVVALTIYLIKNKGRSQLISAKVGPVIESIYGLGKIKSASIFEFKAVIAQTIQKRFVKEGELVSKGQRLLQFSEGHIVSSPISGVVTKLPLHEMENVLPQTTVVRVENLDERYLEVALEQQGALRVRPGQQVKLSFESFRSQLFQGIVETIYPSDDQFIVKITSKNLPKEILPGMTADVAIEVAAKAQVLLAPVKAIANGYATVEKNGKREKLPVQMGASDGEWVELIEPKIDADTLFVVPRK